MMEHTNAVSRRSFITLGAIATATIAGGYSLAMPTEKAYAVTAAQKQAEAREALRKLNAMEEQLDIASADYYTALDEHQAAKDKMDDAQHRIELTTKSIERVQGDLSTRVRSMYRTGSSSVLDMLLGSTSYSAFVNNWNFLNEMNEQDSKMVDESKQLKTDIEQEREIYAEQESIASAKAAEAKEVKKQAEALVEEVQATYDALSEEAAVLLKQERQAAEEEQRRQAAEQEAARRRVAARESQGGGSEKSQSVAGNTVVERAYAHLGIPYGWGATGPRAFDCSGFVSMCLTGQYGKRIGTTYTFMGWTRVKDPRPGDICTNSHHCGIYVGNGRMVHAPRSGDVVKESPVHAGMIYVRY